MKLMFRLVLLILVCFSADIVEDGPGPLIAGEMGPINDVDLPDEVYQKVHEQDYDDEGRAWEMEEEWDDEEWFDEWSAQMEDFVQDMLVSFKLSPKTDEIFHQDVGPEPTLIRGGFFTAGSTTQQSDIEFLVTDPDGEAVVRQNRGESLFHFTTDRPGTYNFIFSNSRWLESKYVTFAVGCGNSTTLRVDHIADAKENARRVEKMVKDVHVESQYLWTRHRGHVRKVFCIQLHPTSGGKKSGTEVPHGPCCCNTVCVGRSGGCCTDLLHKRARNGSTHLLKSSDALIVSDLFACQL